MPITKKFWSDFSFGKEKFPSIQCPACYTGYLENISSSLSYEETAMTSALVSGKNHDWTPMDLRYKFSTMFRCSNKQCKELVSCAGSASYNVYDRYDSDMGGYIDDYEFAFYPEYFSRAIHIFQLKENYPGTIKEVLEGSFKLFFCDSESCANKVRIALEVLLNHLKVKRTTINNKGRRVNLALHQRIELYGKKNRPLADLLLAIKWIGNSGSHESKVNRNDTLDAYRILESVLNSLYCNDDKELRKLAAQINRKKKPVSQVRRKSDIGF